MFFTPLGYIIFLFLDLTWLSVTISMVGKLCITFCYGVVYVYTPELFPTVVRNTALGGASFFEQIGSAIAPFVRELVSVLHLDLQYEFSFFNI